MATLLAFLYHTELVKRSINSRFGKGKTKKGASEKASIDDEEEDFGITVATVGTLLDENIAFYQKDKSKLGKKIVQNLTSIQETLTVLVPELNFLEKECNKFDLSEEESGNGFRSTVALAHSATRRTKKLLQHSSKERSTLLFKKELYLKNLEAWKQCLIGIGFIIDYMKNCLLLQCKGGNLLPENSITAKEFATLTNTMAEYGSSMFGRCFGFQYEDSLRKVFIAFSCTLCAFSEYYYNEGGDMERIKQFLVTGTKYVNNPEKRERRIIKILRNCSVEFIKSFWELNSMKVASQADVMLGGKLQVEQKLFVPCQEMKIKTEDGFFVAPVPSSHVPPKPIRCCLLSASFREGMMVRIPKDTNYLPPSDTVIFHVHGGGFVAQSTRVQSLFLRYWSKKLKVPVFSVDYSLSPEAKYPRQLDEVLSAYIWFLNNLRSLGTKGLKIIATGDSGGGVLISGLTIKCIENNIRPPDGLYYIYTPFNLTMISSPARYLSTYDPLIPTAYAMRLANAYYDSSYINKSLDENEIVLSPFEEGSLRSSNASPNGSLNEHSSSTIATLESSSKESSSSFSDECKADNRAYIEQFLEKFVIDYGDENDKKSMPVLRPVNESMTKSLEPKFSKPKKKDLSNENNGSANTTSNKKNTKQRKIPLTKIKVGCCSLDDVDSDLMDQTPTTFPIGDYCYCPYSAPPQVLSKFPPTHFITCDYDFALDDSVTMAKKLRALGVSVRLKCLKNLPHGYLNVSLASEESFTASKITLDFLQDLVEALQ